MTKDDIKLVERYIKYKDIAYSKEVERAFYSVLAFGNRYMEIEDSGLIPTENKLWDMLEGLELNIKRCVTNAESRRLRSEFIGRFRQETLIRHTKNMPTEEEINDLIESYFWVDKKEKGKHKDLTQAILNLFTQKLGGKKV